MRSEEGEREGRKREGKRGRERERTKKERKFFDWKVYFLMFKHFISFTKFF